MDLFEKLIDENGPVAYLGNKYALIGQPSLSNSVFPGWWGDAKDGEHYVSQWIASGMDREGNEVVIYWEFDAVKGEEFEDDSYWPWENGPTKVIYS